MNFNLKILSILLIILLPSNLCYAVTELTKDNPETLIGKHSENFSIFGVKLGMSHKEAKLALQKDNRLIAEVDSADPSRLYVYNKKGESLLYLIWEPNIETLSKITLFIDSRIYLKDNFKRLMSFESLDENSIFIKKFIGYPNKIFKSLDVPSIQLLHINYLYEDIGIVIIHKKSKDGEKVIFKLVKKSS